MTKELSLLEAALKEERKTVRELTERRKADTETSEALRADLQSQIAALHVAHATGNQGVEKAAENKLAALLAIWRMMTVNTMSLTKRI